MSHRLAKVVKMRLDEMKREREGRSEKSKQSKTVDEFWFQ